LFDRYPNRVDPLGDRSAVAAATPATLRELFDTYYQPNNAQLVLAGDVAAERAFALAERDFGDWQRGPDPFASHPVPVQPALQSDASDVISAPVHVSQLMVAYQGPSTRDDFRDAVAADVLATISKLDGQDFRRLVTGDEIVGARIFHWASPEKGVIGLALTIGSGQEAAAISELRMMRDWLNTITRAQIGAAKDLLWTRRFQDQDVDLTLAQDASADWAASGTGSPHDYLQTLYAIEHADLERVVARYVTGAARAAVLVTDPEHADIDLGATLRAAW
jgi:predicted Zn-dependent peptidase